MLSTPKGLGVCMLCCHCNCMCLVPECSTTAFLSANLNPKSARNQDVSGHVLSVIKLTSTWRLSASNIIMCGQGCMRASHRTNCYNYWLQLLLPRCVCIAWKSCWYIWTLHSCIWCHIHTSWHHVLPSRQYHWMHIHTTRCIYVTPRWIDMPS